MDNFNWILEMPKVELHCHLDGSISPEAVATIADKTGRPAPPQTTLRQAMTAPEDCKSLSEYLSCFDFVLDYLQSEAALEIAGCDVVRQAALDNVVYIEVRFSPMLFCKEGLKPHQAVEAVLRGLDKSQAEHNIKAAAILCMMRHMDEQANQIVLDLARNYLNSGVCAVDIAGDEAAYPMENYINLFRQADKHSIPYTVHAGECGNAENVRLAVELGARRIGHGIALAQNPEIAELCIKKRVLLEVCPTSNIQTKAAAGWAQHPFPKLDAMGINICINTDNRTVSQITLNDEYRAVCEHFGYNSKEQMQRFGYRALEGAFLSRDEKNKIKKMMET
jgi:adenosine deaminase